MLKNSFLLHRLDMTMIFIVEYEYFDVLMIAKSCSTCFFLRFISIRGEIIWNTISAILPFYAGLMCFAGKPSGCYYFGRYPCFP